MEYDFSSLNDKEFELLVCDLLSKKFEKHVERYKPGKDGGVDGRFFSDGEVIIQCKHYLGSGFSALMRSIQKSEKDKVIKLNPSRYIFVCSIPLSKANKEKIKDAFDPYIIDVADVIGREDINDILSDYPEVERKHNKLWLGSTAVLSRFLNSDLHGRNDYELEIMTDEARMFVETVHYRRAAELLYDESAVLITGAPGIGKTTLAKYLAIGCVKDGYSLLVVDDVQEAERLYQEKEKQVFLFDDFLGSNYLETFEGKVDSKIVRFMKRVLSGNNKKIILTSRTNILNMAYSCSDIIKFSKLKSKEYVIDVRDISPIDKAKILYNKIFFSDLPSCHVDEIYKDRRYRGIVNHNNYNPRLIDFIVNGSWIKRCDAAKYWHALTKKMDNPEEVWDTSFRNQSNDYVRLIVYFLVLSGGSLREDSLRDAYERYTNSNIVMRSGHVAYSFNATIKIAQKFFVDRCVNYFAYYQLFNPSIADYVINRSGFFGVDISGVYMALDSDSSIKTLSDFVSNNYFGKSVLDSTVEKLLSYSLSCSYDRMLMIFDIAKKIEKESQYYLLGVNRIVNEPRTIRHVSSFLRYFSELYDYSKIDVEAFLIRILPKFGVGDAEDIQALDEFAVENDLLNGSLYGYISESIESYVDSELGYRADEIYLDDLIDSVDGEYAIDYWEAENRVDEFIESDIYLDLTLNGDYEVDLYASSYSFDVDGLCQEAIDRYTAGLKRNRKAPSLSNQKSTISDIDDLFHQG